MIEKLKYASTERVFEGVIVDHNDASVTIDIKGRLGQFKIPMRMLISDYPVKIFYLFAFLLSYPEVLSEEPDEHYVNAILNTKKLEEEVKNRALEDNENGDKYRTELYNRLSNNTERKEFKFLYT